MKTELFKKVYIKSGDDLPKCELGVRHYAHQRIGNIIYTDVVWTWRTNDIDWYLLPVSLPSDEEIEKEFPVTGDENLFELDYANTMKRDGVKWMRDKLTTK